MQNLGPFVIIGMNCCLMPALMFWAGLAVGKNGGIPAISINWKDKPTSQSSEDEEYA